MQSKTTPTIDAMFYQAASIPLQHIPPLEYLLTRLPRQYPLFPMAAFDPTVPPSSVQHMLYREQRTYAPSTSYSRPTKTAPKPTPRILPTIKLLEELHNAGFKGKDDTALFDFLASNLTPSAPLAIIDAWTDYFRQCPRASHFDTALLFILKLRTAFDQPIAQFEATYADRLEIAFAPVGVTKCSLSWDRNTEYRTWSLTGAVSFIVRPHSKIPNAIHIQLPNLFTRSNTSLYEELLSPHQDQLLLQCEHLAHANGFTLY